MALGRTVTATATDPIGNTSEFSAGVVVVAMAPMPPTIVKSFGAGSMVLGGLTSLSFTINNPNATFAIPNGITLTGVGFTDTLPAGLVVATPNGLTTTCSGTTTAVAGAGSVSLSGATLAAGASCTVSLNVQGTTVGMKNNSVTVSSTEGGTGNTSNAAVTVVAAQVQPPTIAKAFGAASIALNGTTSLTFTLSNPNAAAALTGVGFTDTLPAGLVVATPNGLVTTCSGTTTAVAGAGSASLSGATLAAGASCTVSLNVQGTTVGMKNNSVTVSSTEGGTGNTSNAAVTVVAAQVQPPTIAKAFGAASIALNGTTSLTFTLSNPNAAAALTGVGFTDTLPAGLVVAAPNGLVTTCSGTTTAVAGAEVSQPVGRNARGGRLVHRVRFECCRARLLG